MAKAYISAEKFAPCLSTLEEAVAQVKQLENGDGDTEANLDSYYNEIITCLKQAINEFDTLQSFSKLVSCAECTLYGR